MHNGRRREIWIGEGYLDEFFLILLIIPTSKSSLHASEVFTLPHRFLTESGHSCGFRRNPPELNLAGTSAKFSIPESPNSGLWRNGVIPELEPEWPRNRPERNPEEWNIY